MRTQLIDWRYGREPRQEVIDYFNSKGYLSTSKTTDHNNEQVTVYHIEVDPMGIGRMIQELSERYDIMITEQFFGIDTKGYKFKQR